jgi:hypothetical protein
MSSKKIIFSLSIIILVGAIFIVTKNLNAIRPPEHKTMFFPGLEERHITRLTIKDAGRNTVVVENKAGVWMVSEIGAPSVATDDGINDIDGSDANGLNGGVIGSTGDAAESVTAVNQALPESFPANEMLVQIALERIVSLKKGDLISENPANQATFEVDDASESYVEIFVTGKNAPEHVLRIGKNGPNWTSNYVRLAGSDAVYLASSGLRQSMFFDVTTWKQRMPEPEPEPELELGPESVNIEEVSAGD